MRAVGISKISGWISWVEHAAPIMIQRSGVVAVSKKLVHVVNMRSGIFARPHIRIYKFTELAGLCQLILQL